MKHHFFVERVFQSYCLMPIPSSGYIDGICPPFFQGDPVCHGTPCRGNP